MTRKQRDIEVAALEAKVRDLTSSVDYWGRQATYWQQRYLEVQKTRTSISKADIL